nr:hypothetical transcript [Hymenolepis microstoma]
MTPLANVEILLEKYMSVVAKGSWCYMSLHEISSTLSLNFEMGHTQPKEGERPLVITPQSRNYTQQCKRTPFSWTWGRGHTQPKEGERPLVITPQSRNYTQQCKRTPFSWTWGRSSGESVRLISWFSSYLTTPTLLSGSIFTFKLTVSLVSLFVLPGIMLSIALKTLTFQLLSHKMLTCRRYNRLKWQPMRMQHSS